MAKLQVFDNKQEVEKPMGMTEGGTKPVGPSRPEHNMAAINTGRDYAKKGQWPGHPDTSAFPDGDIRGGTSKPIL